MDITRRNLIQAAGVASLETVAVAAPVGLPDKAEFTVGKSQTCLNNARWHAVQRYLEYKATGGGSAPDYGSDLQSRAKTLFANLIHSKVSELSPELIHIDKASSAGLSFVWANTHVCIPGSPLKETS